MPHTDAKLHYQVQLTDREFRLVTLGLAQKLQDEEDVQSALKLNVQLCHQRVVGLKNQTENAAKALEVASALENPNVPPMRVGQ